MSGDMGTLDRVAYLRLCGLAALIGIPAAVVASLFLAVVHWLQHWLWVTLPGDLGRDSPPWYLTIGILLVGALMVAAARTFLPGDGGHPPLQGLSAEPTPLAHGPSVALAAIGSLAFGAVLGPEAPLIALGSVVGGVLTLMARTDARGIAVLATAGSFSAISSLFGGPLVAAILLVESGIGMGAMLIPALLPGFISAAVGYVVIVGLGDWGGIPAAALTVPGLPLYEGTRVIDLLVAIGVGVVTAILVAMLRQLASKVNDMERRVRVTPLLLAGALVIAGLVIGAEALGADADDVLFSGQASIPALVTETSMGAVLVLVVAKGLAYAVSLGSGFRGGPVFPAIFVGVGLAAVMQIALDLSPTLAVAVGVSAGMASVSRLLVSSVLLAALLVGTNGTDAIPAAVLAAAAAWLTTSAFSPRSDPPGATEPPPAAS